MVADARCSNCRFYQPHDLTGKDERNACLAVCTDKDPHGDCRRAHPTWFPGPRRRPGAWFPSTDAEETSLSGFWPIVLDYEWCGEWMPGDPKVP